MTTTITDTPSDLYDLSMLEEMDDNEYLVEVLTVLLNETPKDLKQMKEGLRSGKAQIVCQAAHRLKSSSGIIQAENFTALLSDIETLGKSGVNNALINLVENAAYQYGIIEKSLKIHIAGLK